MHSSRLRAREWHLRFLRSAARVHTLRPPNQLGEPFLGGFRSTPAARRRGPAAAPNASRSCCAAALALGGGLLVLILIVLGVKGCLDARARTAR